MFELIYSCLKIVCLISFILSKGVISKQKLENIECGLPPECKLVSIRDVVKYGIACTSKNLNLNFNQSSVAGKCKLYNETFVNLNWSARKTILKESENSLVFDYLANFGREFNFITFYSTGFYVSQYKDTFYSRNTYPNLLIVSYLKFDFRFYTTNNQVIRSCKDLSKSNISNPVSIFQTSPMAIKHKILMSYPNFRTAICPLLFSNTGIKFIHIFVQSDTFFKSNKLTFTNDCDPSRIIPSIIIVDLENLVNIRIDLSMLNPYVFSQMKSLSINGFVSSIQEDFLLSFNHLLIVKIDCSKRIFHQQSIKWIRYFNRNMSVNLSDATEIEANFHKAKYIDILVADDSYDRLISETFPDEDFCLYVSFPFEQLVLIGKFYENNDLTYTCTFDWLIKHFNSFSKVNRSRVLFMNGISNGLRSKSNAKINCSFKEMLSKCDFKKSVSVSKLPMNYIKSGINIHFLFTFMIFTKPLVCLMSLLSSIVTAIVISHKENKKDLEEKRHFHYIRIYSISNSINSIISGLDLIAECDLNYQTFCSSISHTIPIQLFVISRSFFENVFTNLSGISMVFLSLCRISLLGKEHGKIVTWASTVNVLGVVICSLIISSALSVSNILNYHLNINDPTLSYPYNLEQAPLKERSDVKSNVIISFNLFSTFFKSVFIVIVQLVVDIGLVVQLRRTLDSKMTTGMSEKQKWSMLKSNERAVKRAVIMVIINASFTFLSRLAFFLNGIYDYFYWKQTDPSFFALPSRKNDFFLLFIDENLRELILSISENICFIIYFSSIVFFIKFDKGFNQNFWKVFKSSKNIL